MRMLDLSQYVLFLDEFASIVEYLVTSSTLDKNRSDVYRLFVFMIQNVKQVICTDADINSYCIDFIKTTNIKFKTIDNRYLHNKNVKASEIYSHESFMEKLKKEDSFLCCTDSKINAELIYNDFKDAEDCILIVSGVDEYVNLDSYKKVIFSPKIVYGLDSIMKRPVYTYYKEHTINPANMVQQVSRCRNITHLHYYFSRKNYKRNDITLDIIRDELKDDLSDKLFYFKNNVTEKLNNQYIELLSKYTYQNYCYSTNKFAHFLNILNQRGFIIDYKYEKTSKDISKELKELKQEKKDNFDVSSPQVEKINEYLKIPEDEIDTYKDLFLDKSKLDEHFIICQYLNKDNDDLLTDLMNNKDFECNKYQSNKMKLLFINELKEKCGCIGVTLQNELNEEDKITYMNKYNKIFRNRDKAINMNTILNLRNVLGSNYLTSKRVGKEKVYEYNINNECVEYHRTIYKFRELKRNIVPVPTKKLFK